MKSLEEILQEYFGCKSKAFLKNGSFSCAGMKAYLKLERLIQDLSSLGLLNYDKVMDEIEEIVRSNN